MENKTKTRTGVILKIMQVLAWLALIGYIIVAGSILISYCVSVINPVASKNLYMGMNLSGIREYSFWQYTMSVSFMVAFLGMKAFISFLAIKTLSKVNLTNPFKIEMTRILELISYALMSTWIIAILNNAHAHWILKKTGVSLEELASSELIFIAGLVFIISQVFKRGVEIQSENELTV